MVLTSNIIIVVLLAILTVYEFSRNTIPLSTKLITRLSFLMAISIVLGTYLKLSISPSFEIKLDTLPILLMGIIGGPFWGLLGGIVTDLLQLVIFPTPMPYFGFTLNLALTGWIAGKTITMNKYYLKGIIISFSILSAALVFFYPTFFIENLSQSEEMVGRILMALGTLAIGYILQLTITRSHKPRLLLKVIISELLVQVVLTSLWLNILLGIPMPLLLIPRMIEAPFMIFILYILLINTTKFIKTL